MVFPLNYTVHHACQFEPFVPFPRVGLTRPSSCWCLWSPSISFFGGFRKSPFGGQKVYVLKLHRRYRSKIDASERSKFRSRPAKDQWKQFWFLYVLVISFAWRSLPRNKSGSTAGSQNNIQAPDTTRIHLGQNRSILGEGCPGVPPLVTFLTVPLESVSKINRFLFNLLQLVGPMCPLFLYRQLSQLERPWHITFAFWADAGALPFAFRFLPVKSFGGSLGSCPSVLSFDVICVSFHDHFLFLRSRSHFAFPPAWGPQSAGQVWILRTACFAFIPFLSSSILSHFSVFSYCHLRILIFTFCLGKCVLLVGGTERADP
jgi:hypothetical protein